MISGRRRFLQGALAALAASSVRVSRAQTAERLGIPGPYRGRVVSVQHPGSIAGGRYQAEPVRAMIDKGLMELTGAPAVPDAWRAFFSAGDVVGIKVNPTGQPHISTSREVLQAVIAGLRSAGVRASNVLVYDRYENMFLDGGYDKCLPPDVRWTTATKQISQFQLDMEGYDEEHYMEMALLLPGASLTDHHFRRSYVARFLTQQVDKMVNLTTLKHHQSAGVTLALKNMSHGLVNNVSRSHSTPTLNACGLFIPSVVDLPVIRAKVVLHIVEGLKGAYHGGPNGSTIGKYTWEHKTIYFATDPVALDHIGWKIIDQKRAEMKMLPVAVAAPDRVSTFLRAQPEHIEIAGSLGLGEFDEKKIDWRRCTLG